MRGRAGLALALVTAVGAVLPPAAAAEPSLRVDAPSAAFSVGDRVPVQVTAVGGAGALWGELTVSTRPGGPWAVVEGPTPVAAADPPAWQVVAVPLEVGELALPEMSASLRSGAAEPIRVTPDGETVVTVASVLPPDQEVEPRPMRDPVGVSGMPWEWLVPALPPLLLLAALAWWLLRRRRRGVPGERTTLSPGRELAKALEELETRIGREPAAAVCDRLATAVRRYLERRTGRPALEMTSFELRLLAKRSAWPEAVRRALHRVMGRVDDVRFGRAPVSDDDLLQAVGEARQLADGVEAHLAPEEAGDVRREVAS